MNAISDWCGVQTMNAISDWCGVHTVGMLSVTGVVFRLSQCKTTIAELNGLMKSQLEGEASKTDMEDEEDDVRLPVLQRNVQNMLQQLQHEQVIYSLIILSLV